MTSSEMITHLESLGYKVVPARNESLFYSCVTKADKSERAALEKAFEWEAVHMIARQLHPGLIDYQTNVQLNPSYLVTFQAKLII